MSTHCDASAIHFHKASTSGAHSLIETDVFLSYNMDSICIQLSIVCFWVQKMKEENIQLDLSCTGWLGLLKNHTRLLKRNSFLIYWILYTVYYSQHSVVVGHFPDIWGTFFVAQTVAVLWFPTQARWSHNRPFVRRSDSVGVSCIDDECLHHLHGWAEISLCLV